MDFNELNGKIKSCTNCRLHKSRINSITGEGNFHAGIMIIAQAPGKDEDSIGKMFIGPSGKIFDRLLLNAGIRREDIYLTNLIKCYLPKCRRPSKNEIEQCSTYLDKEIEIIDPKLIVTLGFHATRYIFKKYNLNRPPKKEYKNLFGKQFYAKNRIIFPVRHPTAVLFNPEKEEILQENYNQIRKILS
ncbi:MAG: uracil-DNA glycosylase [Bacteroidetes bacterium]|nr:uracil-DNA glycosylase [Bacteroidota bacterium]